VKKPPPKPLAARDPEIAFEKNSLDLEIEIARVRLEMVYAKGDDPTILKYLEDLRRLKASSLSLQPQTGELTKVADISCQTMGRNLRLQARVKTLRLHNHWTQAQLAGAAQVPIEAVCTAEMDLRQLDADSLARISSTLGISEEEVENA
jgi:DNA-binding XRE family transcriptional regulator